MSEAVRPRAFHQMRPDRLMAMAKSRFGQSFGSAADAAAALSRLPVREQRALKKPREPGRVPKMPSTTLGFVRNAAVGEINAAATTYRTMSRYSTAVGVGVAARQASSRATDDGKTGSAYALAVVQGTALPAMLAAAPLAAQASSNAATKLSAYAARKLPARTASQLGVQRIKTAARAGGLALRGVAYGAILVRPLVTALSAYEGAREDQHAWRGAARGALRSLDPSGIFLDAGIVERGFDRVFGRADPPKKRVIDASNRRPSAQPNGGERKYAYVRRDGTTTTGTASEIAAWQSRRMG